MSDEREKVDVGRGREGRGRGFRGPPHGRRARWTTTRSTSAGWTTARSTWAGSTTARSTSAETDEAGSRLRVAGAPGSAPPVSGPGRASSAGASPAPRAGAGPRRRRRRRRAARATRATSAALPSSSPSAARARRARSSRSSPIAAWVEKRDSSSSSASPKGRSGAAVEHREDAERALVVEERARRRCSSGRSRSPPARSREKRGSASRSSTTSGWRVTSAKPAMPVLDGNRVPTSAPLAPARRPPRRRARPPPRRAGRSTPPRRRRSTARRRRSTASSSRNVSSSPPSIPVRRRAGGVQLVAHASTSGVRRGQVEHALQLVRRQLRVLREHQRGDPGDVRRREAVAGAAERAAARPRDLDVDAAREELDRRVGVRVPDERIALLVAADRDDGREPPRVAVHRQVVRGRDEDRPVEVREVGELVQLLGEAALRGREAEADHPVARLDRVTEAREDQVGGARRPGAEHADASGAGSPARASG